MPLQLTWFSGEFSSSSISILPLSVETCHQAMPPLLCLVQAASFWSSIPSVPSRWPFFTSFLFPLECPARPFLPVGIKRDPYEPILQRSKLVVKPRLPFRTEYMPPFFWVLIPLPVIYLSAVFDTVLRALYCFWKSKKDSCENRALTSRSSRAALCFLSTFFGIPLSFFSLQDLALLATTLFIVA